MAWCAEKYYMQILMCGAREDDGEEMPGASTSVCAEEEGGVIEFP